MNLGIIKQYGLVAEFKRRNNKVLKNNIVRTAGLFIINPKDELLVGHPTNHDPNFWSVPKGRIEDGETTLEAGIRETYEETNVNLKPLYDEGILVYNEAMIEIYKHKKKALYPFIIYTEKNTEFNFESINLKCSSFVEVPGGVDFPEMDEVKWMPIEEAIEKLHLTQIKVLKNL